MESVCCRILTLIQIIKTKKGRYFVMEKKPCDIRREIFEETQRLYSSNESLIRSIEYSKQHQRFIAEADKICTHQGNKYDEPAKVRVSMKRSLKVAQGYSDMKVCVHNFASASNPGGGVTKGSNAQEEAICRCSTLYPCISDESMMNQFYNAHREALRAGKMNALYNNDCIYTPSVMVFREDNKNYTPIHERIWFKIDVISCAAPNLRNMPSNAMNPDSGDKAVKISQRDLLELHKSRIRRVLDIALTSNEEVLILGAFGCGAFQNPPNIVAEAMAGVIKDYLYCFRAIEFAIYCTPDNSTNYNVFSRRLSSLCK